MIAGLIKDLTKTAVFGLPMIYIAVACVMMLTSCATTKPCSQAPEECQQLEQKSDFFHDKIHTLA